MDRQLVGPFAGFVATLPMTVAMELMHRRLPPRQRYPLPPREVAMNALGILGVRGRQDEPTRALLAVATHFAIGTTAGAFYPPIARHVPGNPIAKGVAFGLAVWAGGYLGLLPATGLLSPATEHPRRRTALMIASHVAWGATLGALANRLGGDRPSG